EEVQLQHNRTGSASLRGWSLLGHSDNCPATSQDLKSFASQSLTFSSGPQRVLRKEAATTAAAATATATASSASASAMEELNGVGAPGGTGSRNRGGSGGGGGESAGFRKAFLSPLPCSATQPIAEAYERNSAVHDPAALEMTVAPAAEDAVARGAHANRHLRHFAVVILASNRQYRDSAMIAASGAAATPTLPLRSPPSPSSLSMPTSSPSNRQAQSPSSVQNVASASASVSAVSMPERHPLAPSPLPLPPPAVHFIRTYDLARERTDEVTTYVEWHRSRMQQHSALGTSWLDAVHLFGIALRDYRCLLLSLNYGYNYGAQMALYNLLTLYLFQRYGMSFIAAGALAAMPGLLNAVMQIYGSCLSGLVGRSFGMRGRLWLLWASQSAGGLCCLLLGRCRGGSSGLTATALLLLLFALSTQIAAGATYAIMPYVSYRAFASVMGITSSGGQLGGVLLMLFFFVSRHMSYEQGLFWMGVTILVVSSTLLLLRFPTWGGMLTGAETPYGGFQKEDYYLSESTPAAQDSGPRGEGRS
ncbi:hypothetical protein VaNZ11_014560, partial [Volvox africanus]